MSEGTLTWVIALGVITVVVSCCVLYAIRQVFSLTEKVNKSQNAVSQLEEMQTQLKVLQEIQQQQKKIIAEKEAEEERRRREKENDEARNHNSQEKLISRLENLEKGLIEHESKVEDVVGRALVSDGRSLGRSGIMKKSGGGGASLGATAKRLMAMNRMKPKSKNTGASGDDINNNDDFDNDEDDDDDDTKSILDMNVLEFAKIMQATNGGTFSSDNFSPSSSSSRQHNVQFSPSGPMTNNNHGYTPSPMFRQLLEHGSLSKKNEQENESDPLKKLSMMSPSNGVFSSSNNSPNNSNQNHHQLLLSSMMGNNQNNNNNNSHQQKMMIINSFLSRTNAVGGNGVLRQPPSFWTYEKSFSAAGSLRSMKRRLHSISFIIGDSSDKTNNNGDEEMMMDYSPSKRRTSSLVLKFAMAESISSSQQQQNETSSPSRSQHHHQYYSGRSDTFDSSMTSSSIDMGLPADGAGPGVSAIPLLSITLVEITTVSPFSNSSSFSSSSSSSRPSAENGKDIIEAFSYVCGSGVPILAFRIEHRGELGEWKFNGGGSPSRDRSSANNNNDSSSSSISATSGWTRLRALQKASTIPNASAQGTASTAFTFYVPFTRSNSPMILHYVEYLRKLLDHVVAIDGEARRILIEGADRLMSMGTNNNNASTNSSKNNTSVGNNNHDNNSKKNDDDLSMHHHLL